MFLVTTQKVFTFGFLFTIECPVSENFPYEELFPKKNALSAIPENELAIPTPS